MSHESCQQSQGCQADMGKRLNSTAGATLPSFGSHANDGQPCHRQRHLSTEDPGLNRMQMGIGSQGNDMLHPNGCEGNSDGEGPLNIVPYMKQHGLSAVANGPFSCADSTVGLPPLEAKSEPMPWLGVAPVARFCCMNDTESFLYSNSLKKARDSATTGPTHHPGDSPPHPGGHITP